MAMYLANKYGEAISHDSWLSTKRDAPVAGEELEPARRHGIWEVQRQPAEFFAFH